MNISTIESNNESNSNNDTSQELSSNNTTYITPNNGDSTNPTVPTIVNETHPKDDSNSDAIDLNVSEHHFSNTSTR